MNRVTVDMRMSPSEGKGDHVRVSRIAGELLLDGLLEKEWDVGLWTYRSTSGYGSHFGCRAGHRVRQNGEAMGLRVIINYRHPHMPS